MWPLTRNRPKHLLPVAGKPMLNYLMGSLEETSEIDEIYISTNMRFQDQFRRYVDGLCTAKGISLFIEDSRCEEEKLGSCLLYTSPSPRDRG